MLNVRDPKREAKVRRIARARKLTKSQVVREAIDLLPEREPTAYDLWKDAIGIYDGKMHDRAENHSRTLKKLLRDKHDRTKARGQRRSR